MSPSGETPQDLSQPALDALREEAVAAINAAADLDALAEVRTIHVSGRGAALSLARRSLGSLPGPERAEPGKRLNALTSDINEAFERRSAELNAERDTRVLVEEAVDVTVPAARAPIGSRHPLSLVVDRVVDVFTAMGYEVAEGPEAEHGWFNFDALNTPPDHASRELQDTLYLQPLSSQVVLRTQTSPVQIRAMLERELPLYIVCPGRVFRADTIDATHLPVFTQLEGLAVDDGLTMGDLRGTLDAFAAAMFGGESLHASNSQSLAPLRTRLRPHFFPFTEPSAEIDLQCFGCGGEPPDPDCRICGGEGWLEWGGCGMVDPAVLTSCGIDPQRYTGFAFGMGLERTVMALHGLSDMRVLLDGDVRFGTPFAGGRVL
jgi:phenylalanyl-tRNA synthetase alpha chain